MNTEQLTGILQGFIDSGQGNKAEDYISNMVVDSSEDRIAYLNLFGTLCMKNQLWGKAINAFQRVLDIDSENTEAKTQMNMVQSILDYTHTDSYNP